MQTNFQTEFIYPAHGLVYSPGAKRFVNGIYPKKKKFLYKTSPHICLLLTQLGLIEFVFCRILELVRENQERLHLLHQTFLGDLNERRSISSFFAVSNRILILEKKNSKPWRTNKFRLKLM